jgi:hypothetical protein
MISRAETESWDYDKVMLRLQLDEWEEKVLEVPKFIQSHVACVSGILDYVHVLTDGSGIYNSFHLASSKFNFLDY